MVVHLIVIYQGGVVESTMELGWELDMVGRVRFVVIVLLSTLF